MTAQTHPGPHQGMPVLRAGKPLEQAQAAMVMIHGRGATAESILSLVPEIEHPQYAFLAPQAAGNTWYPYSFLAPLDQNEPYLSSALAAVSGTLRLIAEARIPPERMLLLGFSQGACLAVEFAARHARRYGAVIGLSGGLIGPDGTPRNYPGSLQGTPVFLGCSDPDMHIPRGRVEESARLLQEMHGAVTMRLYPHLGHTINDDEIRMVRSLMAGALVG